MEHRDMLLLALGRYALIDISFRQVFLPPLVVGPTIRFSKSVA